MKISKSVRDLFNEIEPTYQKLKVQVDKVVEGRKHRRWHYESRVKEEQSFALKLETGRVKCPRQPEDFFGATLVVEKKARIDEAEKFVTDLFPLAYKRPKDSKRTHLEPFSFDFDDLRLYVKYKDDPALPATGLDGIVFEVQIRTFLQHAWGIATHDFIYKSDEVQWSTSRIAFQVKAMLENAELSIGEADKLTSAAMLDRMDWKSSDLKRTIADIRGRWEKDQLPKDLRRLGQNILELSEAIGLAMEELWRIVDEATAAGEGAKTINLSPYGAIITAVLKKWGPDGFRLPGEKWNKSRLFVPNEIDLPAFPADVQAKVIRTDTKP